MRSKMKIVILIFFAIALFAFFFLSKQERIIEGKEEVPKSLPLTIKKEAGKPIDNSKIILRRRSSPKTIQVIVRDFSGKSIPGAKIVLPAKDPALFKSGITNEHGRLNLPLSLMGRKIRIQKTGFFSTSRFIQKEKLEFFLQKKKSIAIFGKDQYGKMLTDVPFELSKARNSKTGNKDVHFIGMSVGREITTIHGFFGIQVAVPESWKKIRITVPDQKGLLFYSWKQGDASHPIFNQPPLFDFSPSEGELTLFTKRLLYIAYKVKDRDRYFSFEKPFFLTNPGKTFFDPRILIPLNRWKEKLMEKDKRFTIELFAPKGALNGFSKEIDFLGENKTIHKIRIPFKEFKGAIVGQILSPPLLKKYKKIFFRGVLTSMGESRSNQFVKEFLKLARIKLGLTASKAWFQVTLRSKNQIVRIPDGSGDQFTFGAYDMVAAQSGNQKATISHWNEIIKRGAFFFRFKRNWDLTIVKVILKGGKQALSGEISCKRLHKPLSMPTRTFRGTSLKLLLPPGKYTVGIHLVYPIKKRLKASFQLQGEEYAEIPVQISK